MLELKKLADKLAALGVDWTAPETGAQAASLDASFHLDGNLRTIKAGQPIKLVGTISNTGTAPAYRVHARVKSDDAALFGIGTVAGVFFLAAVRVTTRAREVEVPNLYGKSLEEARGLLAERGLVVRVDDVRRPDKTVPADHILSQEPAAGQVIRRQRPVRLRVSDGQRAGAWDVDSRPGGRCGIIVGMEKEEISNHAPANRDGRMRSHWHVAAQVAAAMLLVAQLAVPGCELRLQSGSARLLAACQMRVGRFHQVRCAVQQSGRRCECRKPDVAGVQPARALGYCAHECTQRRVQVRVGQCGITLCQALRLQHLHGRRYGASLRSIPRCEGERDLSAQTR